MIKINVKVRGSTNGISNKYSITFQLDIINLAKHNKREKHK